MTRPISVGPGIHDGDPGPIGATGPPKKKVIVINLRFFMIEVDSALMRIAKEIGAGYPYETVAPGFDSKYFRSLRFRFKTVQFSNEFSGPLKGLRNKNMIGAEANYFFQGLLAQQMDQMWGTFRVYLTSWKMFNIVKSFGKYSMPSNLEITMAKIGYNYGIYYQKKEDRAWARHLSQDVWEAERRGLSPGVMLPVN